jgi:thioredoxin reductase
MKNQDKKFFVFSLLLFSNFIYFSDSSSLDASGSDDYSSIPADYDWTIIGGGPAGIIAVCLLLDMGMNPKRILWIDPTFSVGRMGDFYQGVVGNTDNQSWIDFLTASPTMAALVEEDVAYINTLSSDAFEPLSLIVKPLEKVTQYLKNKVVLQEGFTNALDFHSDVWHVALSRGDLFTSRHVILATGSKPKELAYEHDAHVIPLDYALNYYVLQEIVHRNDTVGVFGSAHSAILILKYLCDIPHRDTYSFYNSEVSYAIDASGNMTNNPFGLKGKTAEWARDILEKSCPENLHRVKNTKENRETFLPLCNKVIFAVGYKQNTIPVIQENGTSVDTMNFDPQTGVIGTRLYGIGIAFPGAVEKSAKTGQIGLFSFMKYALLAMPEWAQTRSIFDISPLELLREIAIFDDYIVIEEL